MIRMKSSFRNAQMTGAALAFAIVAATASLVFAQEMTSTSFGVGNQGFSTFGGYSTTSHFSTFMSGGPAGQGESASDNFMLQGGYEYFGDGTSLLAQNWRWYDDSLSNTPTVALAAENTAPNAVQYDDPLKLRITVNNPSTDVNNMKLRLQVSTSSDFTESVYYVAEQGECSEASPWCYADGGGANNGVIDSKVLSDAQSCAGGVGNGCGSYNESGTSTSLFIHYAGTRKEYDFVIKQTDAVQSVVYFFRLVNSVTAVPIPLNTGETYPSLTVDGGTLSFSVGGITSGEATEGETTDITTSPTAVEFGTLAQGAATIAAHRLSVTSNAGNGYKIYTFQRQGLIGSSGEIDPVQATNDAPLGWTLGCPATSTGCYGYHTGKDVLDGGSTRFAADDTFARFTEQPTEVAYSAGAVEDEETDILYKVEVRSDQEAGSFQSAIVYIVVPVF